MSDRIAAYYDRLAAEHGHSYRAVDVTSQAALDSRYRAIADVTDMNHKTVLDIGCGYGGLGVYLRDRYPQIRYTGVDISRRLIEIGSHYHPDLDLRHGDLLELPDSIRADVVAAQGIFYKLPGETFWKTTRQMITRMYQLAGEAVAFTAITTSSSGEYGLDPARAFTYCTTLTPYVTLRHDYRPGDICLYLYRREQ